MSNTVYLPDDAESQLIREITKRSFYRFVQEFWHTIITEEPSWNWHIKYLCDELQIVAERIFAKQQKAYDVLINISPGTTKCEVAGNPILTPNGYVPIEELDLEDRVLSLGKDNNLFEQRIVSKGSYYADCVTVYSHLGDARTYSSNHPFLTQRGWVEAKDLTENDFVQVLCTKLPTNERISDAELDFITLMLFEGSTIRRSKSFTNYDSQVTEVFYKACKNLGLTVISHADKRRGFYRIRDSKSRSGWGIGGCGGKLGTTKILLQKYGIDNCLSKHKRLPKQFFTMPIEQKYRFVGLMIATDGFFNTRDRTLQVTLASKGLIQDIKRLLGSMGIMSTFTYRPTKYVNKNTGELWHGHSWNLNIHRETCGELFERANFLQKQHKLSAICADFPSQYSETWYFPMSLVLDRIKNGKVSISQSQVTYTLPRYSQCKQKGRRSFRLTRTHTNKVSRVMVEKILPLEPNLQSLYDSPCRWSKVKKVEEAGKQRVYHIGLEATDLDEQSYFSDNYVVHNSTICSVMFSIWIWTRMPHAKIIACSHTMALAHGFSRKSRDVVKSELYKKCFPEIQIELDQATHFTNTEGGERYAVGVGGTVTGKHANCIIIDDPIDPQAANSEAALNTANLWLHETIVNRAVNMLVTPTIMIMQRLHQDDPTGNWISHAPKGSYKHICLPADCSEGQTVLPPKLKEHYKGGLFDPVRLPRAKLKYLQQWMGEYGYACQYDQHPIPRSGGMFLVDRLKIAPVDPADAIVVTVRYWDKAVSLKKHAAYTVGVKIGKTKAGKFYVLDVIRGRWDSDARERLIKTTAVADGKKVIVGIEQEPGSGGLESALHTVRNLAGFTCKIDKADIHKETRAEPFSSQVNGYNVTLVPGGWNTEYISELQYFPNSKYKDQVDASAGAFNMIATMTRRVASGW